MSSEGPGPLDRTLSYRLHLVNKLTDKSSGDAYAKEFGLPVGQARCLAAIGHFEPLSVVELAARSNLDKAQASRAARAPPVGAGDGADRAAQRRNLRLPLGRRTQGVRPNARSPDRARP